MPLPDSREETATAASQVRSTTINAIQDAIIALGNPNVGRWQWWSPSLLGTRYLSAGNPFVDNIRNLVFPTAPNTGSLGLPILLPVGTRILSVGIRFKHKAGEPAGAGGGITVQGYRESIHGIGVPQVLAGNPAGTGGRSVDIAYNNGGGAVWDEQLKNIEQTQLHAVLQADYTYQMIVNAFTDWTVEGIGIRYLPDNTH